MLLDPRRIIGFLVTTGLLVGLLIQLPVDEQRAYSLTAANLAHDELLPPLAEAHRARSGMDGEVLIRAGLLFEAPEPVREEITSLARQAGFDLVTPGEAPVTLEITAVDRPEHVVLIATLSGVDEPTSGVRRIGDWRSVLPPLFAILVALFFRRLLIALGGAILLGALLHFTGNPLSDLWHGVDSYFWGNLSASFNIKILAFTFALVGMVLVSTKAGGSQGLIDLVGRMADSARSTRVATWLMGLVIFFDDYANSIVVGTTVRPMADRHRISREKLSYIVDSTAAPVAGIAIISTWIAFELGLLQPLIDQVGLELEPGQQTSAYALFLNMLLLRFYCVFTLAFVLTGAVTGRDFGPMLRAERRAFETGQVSSPDAKPLTSRAISEVAAEPGIPCRWYNAAVPVLVVVLAVLVGMLWSGRPAVEAAGLPLDPWAFETWKIAFGEADSGLVLLVASLIGSGVAIAMAVGQRLLGPGQAVVSWFRGIPAMGMAVAILVCAWAIRSVCADLGTNVFIISAIGEAIPPVAFPIFTFCMAAGIAFATGTSWGTMGILLPVVLPWAYTLSEATGTGVIVVVLSAAAVLDGAIMGDHCSPISDTTVLSSIATSCDHIDHVRTQLPYALTCTALAAGAYLAMAGGAPLWSMYAAGLIAVIAVYFVIGRRVRQTAPTSL